MTTQLLSDYDEIMDSTIEIEFDTDLVPEVYLSNGMTRVCITPLFNQAKLDDMTANEIDRLRDERQDILAENAAM